MGNVSNALVSIITPCHNTGSILHRLLDSVLLQDYPTVEMYCIDDGSTDNTKSVIESYFQKFEEKGYKLNYVYQKNAGQSNAINNALKLVKGKYLLWPDSDDFYCSKSFISILVNKFEELPDEYGLIRSALQFVDENTLEVQSTVGLNARTYDNFELFEDCLFSKNGFYFPPIAYMCRLDYLKQVTGLNIFCEKDAGQNWQIMLPILAKYKSYTVKQVLCSVLVRANSHSRGQYTNLCGVLNKLESYENTIVETLNQIIDLDQNKKSYYISEIHKRMSYEKFYAAIRHKSNDKVRRLYRELISSLGWNPKDYILFLATFVPFGLTLYVNFRKLYER